MKIWAQLVVEVANKIMKEKKQLVTRSCVLFRCLIWRPQILNLRSWNQICRKLLLSRELRHFRGSRFSQCFILSLSPHYSLPSTGFLSDAWFGDLKFLIWGLEIKFVKNYFFHENYVTSEGAVSHNNLYYQPLLITRNQERFYANKYFE